MSLEELDNPQIRGFLPMLYVAWADGDLEDREIDTINARLQAHSWLMPAARETLDRWLNPNTPPDAVQLAELLAQIRRSAGNVSLSRRCDLVELSQSLAVESSEAPHVRTAIEEIQDALGLVGVEACEQLLGEAAAATSVVEQIPISFDPATMQRLLDAPSGATPGELEARVATREFLANVHRRAFDLPRAAYREQVLAWLGELAASKLSATAFPGVTSDVEGLGPFMATFETLGFGDLSLLVKFGVQFGLFGGSIYFLGSEEQRKTYLKQVASLELPGCFAMSELGHGSNVAGLETTATYDADADSFIIHTPSESARKEWIGNAALHAQVATVFAQLRVGDVEHGVHAFLVRIRDEDGSPRPGVRIGDNGPKMGLEGVDNGRLWFDQVRIPRKQMLARFAQVDDVGNYASPIASPSKRFFTMIGTLVAGRLSVAAGGLSAAKKGLAIAVRYAQSRRQFGSGEAKETRLIDYRSHQVRLMPRIAEAYAMHFALADARTRYHAAQSGDTREVEAHVAGLKAYATTRCCDTLRECRECCGGQGYLLANQLPQLLADTEIFKTFEGDNAVLYQLAAKSLLGEYRRQFSDFGLVKLLKTLSRRVSVTLNEKGPLVARNTDAAHLLDRDYHRLLFRERRQRLIHTAAMRIKKRIDRGDGAFHAVIDVGDHLIEMAQTHVEYEIRNTFQAAIDGLEPSAEQESLSRLYDLWTLWRMEQGAAWFVDHGFFEAGKLTAIRREVRRLAKEVRGDARGLVDAFGIPDEALAAPIAFGDPAVPTA